MSAPVDRFIHIGDLHFWRVVFNPVMLFSKRFLGNLNVLFQRRHEFAMELAEPFAAHLASLDINSVILTGDMTSTATKAEFAMARAFADRLRDHGLKCLAIPGNHDVYTFRSERRQRFREYFAPYMPERLPGIERLPGGTPVLFVPTVSANWLSSKGRVTTDEVATTRRLLDTTEGQAVIAAHYPVLNRTGAYELSEGRALRNAHGLRETLGETGRPLLYVAGHTHRFSHVRDTAYPDMEHVTVGALFRKATESGLLGEFAVVEVMKEGFRIIRHTYDGSWRPEALSHPD
jgi:hypothetical protein